MRVVNLSRRPFVNVRPVVRLAVLLWVLGGALLAANVYLYTNHWLDSAQVRGELAAIESEIEREHESFGDLKERFQRLDLDSMNLQTTFLNALIRDRTFPWSALFEDLEDVLPFEVQLASVQPDVAEDTTLEEAQRAADRRAAERRAAQRRTSSRRQSSSAPPPPPRLPPPPADEVTLSLVGTAKSGEAVLDFVDALFDHPSFRQPKLLRENFDERTGLTAFDITTFYRTKSATAAALTADSDLDGAAEAGDPEDGDPEDDADVPWTGADAESPSGVEPSSAAHAAGPEDGGAPTGEPRAGDRRAWDSGSGDRAEDDEPAATMTSVPPRRGARTTGVPPSVAPPSALPPSTAGTILVGPAVTAPTPPPGVPPAARPPTGRAGSVPPAAGQPPSAAPGRDEPRTAPRFVEPSASDAPQLRRGGSGGSRP